MSDLAPEVQNFLETDTPRVIKGMTVDEDRRAEVHRKQEIIAKKRAAKARVEKGTAYCEHLMDMRLSYKEAHDLDDDADIFGVALFTIALRDSFAHIHKTGVQERYDLFDEICAKAQKYYDTQTEEEPTDGS